MSLWYVWLVGRWYGDDWRVLGIFSTREKARAAAISGCFIATLPLDDTLVGDEEMAVEWVE